MTPAQPIVIDSTSDVPPFEQIRARLAHDAADGSLPAGHRLPTVRALAAEVGVAVNTVAKAYRALEADGVVETRGRAGTVIAQRHGTEPAAQDAADAYVRAVRRSGLTRAEAVLLVESRWT
jgi:DNA-binding transcriptional regulator YhcF (GntR family)